MTAADKIRALTLARYTERHGDPWAVDIALRDALADAIEAAIRFVEDGYDERGDALYDHLLETLARLDEALP